MRWLVVVAALCMLVFAGTANAKVWTGSTTDPRGDAPPADDGGPPADLRQVSARYDERKGSLTATFTLWDSPPPYVQWYMNLTSCNGGNVNAQFDWPGRYGGMLVTIGTPPNSSDFITGPPDITRKGKRAALRFDDPRLAGLGLRCVTQSLVGPSFFGPFDSARAFRLR